MSGVTPYLVSVPTKHGISVIYHSLLWYIPQHGAFDLNHRCDIFGYKLCSIVMLRSTEGHGV